MPQCPPIDPVYYWSCKCKKYVLHKSQIKLPITCEICSKKLDN